MTDSAQEPSITIPYVDIRGKTPVDLMKEHKDKALNIIATVKGMYGLLTRALCSVFFPVGDFLSRRWLKKTDNPYLQEIEAFGEVAGTKGMIALNMCYEFACTTGAFMQNGVPFISRILDWGVPRMGENLVVAHQNGPAGEFHNVTWPGVSGMFNAVAKGRFAAAINQAPMRRTKLGKAIPGVGYISNWLRNRHLVNKEKALPPAHLLRKVFETAANYDEAKKMLMETPISIPVIYTLTGTRPDEGCVIERLENKASVMEMGNAKVFTANHFQTELKDVGAGWSSRGNDSPGRVLCATNVTDMTEGFEWFKDPIANDHSCLVMVADAAEGTMRLVGTNGPKIVTKVFKL